MSHLFPHVRAIALVFAYCLGPLAKQAQPATQVRFQVDARALGEGAGIGLRGNCPPLSWDQSLPLADPDGDGIWEAELSFAQWPLSGVLEYKYTQAGQTVRWEMAGSNRLLLAPGAGHTQRDIWAQPGSLDPDGLPLLSAEALLADFAIARQALLELHPGLYRYRSPAEVDSLFAHYAALFGQPMDRRRAYLLYSELLAAFRCGHTYANFWNQSGLIQALVIQRADKVPFTFRLAEGRMVVMANASGEPGLDGRPELLAINGEPVPALLARLLPLVKADGSNDAKRLADLNLFGWGEHEAFDVYFPLISPPSEGRYRLRLRAAGQAESYELSVPAISRQDRAERLRRAGLLPPDKPENLWAFRFLPDGTAYLQIGTFVTYNMEMDWKGFLDAAFEQMRQAHTRRLIVDIRWNEGGMDEVGLYLGRLLAKAPVRPIARSERLRYVRVSEALRPYLSTWDETWFDLSGRVRPLGGGFYAPKTAGQAKAIRPAKRAFEGEVYLLVNAANSSATFYLAELAKASGMATLVGEQTGGSQRGLNGGMLFFVRLPHSGIEFDIPLIGSFSEDQPDAGIAPDIEVREDVRSLQEGRDAVLEALLGS